MTNKNMMIAAIGVVAMLGAGSALAQRGGGMHKGMSFEALDADGDGGITREEVRAHMTARFADADTDGDGQLTSTELEAAAQARVAQRVARMIERLDADGNGTLEADEMPKPRREGRMFQRFDDDGDGRISKAEYDAAHAKMGRWGKRHKDRH